MISKDKVAEVLEAAADLYESEQYEWCQGAYFRGDFDIGISMCASQALRTACGERLYAVSEHTRAVRADTQHLDRPLLQAAFEELDLAPYGEELDRSAEGFLIAWNDDGWASPDSRRTKQEVIDLFKDKAKELRNQA